mgnify:CR=1 FL=1
MIALAPDRRLATPAARTAFLVTRVGLAGADMGAGGVLPRVIGQGRASELLFTGRTLEGEEAERWGFFNRLCDPEQLLAEATTLARQLAQGPTFAHAPTQPLLPREWSMDLDSATHAAAEHQEAFRQNPHAPVA